MIKTRIANEDDIDNLVPLVGQYHSFELVDSSYQHRKEALSALLTTDSRFGFLLVATSKDTIIGYMAICFSYSIEHGGREAFIDEFYLVEPFRDQGIGSNLLETAKEYIKGNGIQVLHLEIAQNNHNAKKLYKKHGFESRDQFHLMSCSL